MTRRLSQYLYLYEPLEMEIAAAEVPDASTLSLKLCSSQRGDPDAIAAGVEVTASAVDGAFVPVIPSDELVAALAASYVTKRVWGHLYDDAGTLHDVYEFVVTDVDPDLMPALTV